VSPIELSDEAIKLLSEVRDLEDRAHEIRAEIARLSASAREGFEIERKDIAKDRAVLDALIESRSEGYKLIAEAWADYELARVAAAARPLERHTLCAG